MKKYDIFLVDADDTLFDFTACLKNALRRAFEVCGFSYNDGYYLKYLEINNRLWKKLERQEITHEDILLLRFQQFLKLIGEKEEKAFALNAAYVSALSQECITVAGAEEFLKALSALGKVYIITNGTASVQRGRFKKFPLTACVEEVFISEEMGAYKPSKNYFSLVAERIPHFQKERALIIGDSLTSDIALAHTAGVDCVWFNPLKKPLQGDIKPTYTAQNYQQILNILHA